MKVLPKKEFIEQVVKEGLEAGFSEEESRRKATLVEAIHVLSSGEILVRKGSSSGIKLHEIGHKELGHSNKYSDPKTGSGTIGDDIYDEILAEKYSYDSKEKTSTYRLVIPAINMLILKYSWSPESAVFWSLHILKKELGIIPTKSEKRELARHARGLHRRPK